MWESVVLVGATLVVIVLVAIGVVELLDLRERRSVERFGSPEAFWHAYLTRPPIAIDHRLGRLVVRRTAAMQFCKKCFAPFSGPVGPLSRRLGHGPSPQNPDFCRRCFAHAPLGGAEVEITVLFADLRDLHGSTGFGEELPAGELSSVLNRFYASVVPVLVRHSALVDKLVGDQVMALFVPAFAGPDHGQRALTAGAEILRSAPAGTDIRIGVATGPAFVGVLGMADGVTDFTAVGHTVNVAARLAAEAAVGELLVSGSDTVHSLREPSHRGPSTGKRVRRSRGPQPRFGWASLTATERDVAELVAEGCTNRDIATRLVMSPYTVDTHLRHVFAKLRLRSRAALAAEVARQRTTAP